LIILDKDAKRSRSRLRYFPLRCYEFPNVLNLSYALEKLLMISKRIQEHPAAYSGAESCAIAQESAA